MLLGSRYFQYDRKKDYLLFLEDHEQFSGIDEVSSFLSHIEQDDFISQVRGLLFGHYSMKHDPVLMRRLKRFGEQYSVLVIYTDDFGHGINHGILPIGQTATLDSESATLSFNKWTEQAEKR